ncbi:MAG: DegT/DnrJ/EryC1/StrS family aminotransferase [Microbacteriaceae bacterium]|nr:DegT/DnrJ/EryC1/StrS family aminotransferase [Microbacteriaceae bacterium]
MVPSLDLGSQHRAVEAEVLEGFARVMAASSYVLGPEVAAFETEYAAFSGTAHAIGVGNGTDAIELALRAAGIGEGDEVILPANTFVATAEGVQRAGATIVLVDCDDYYLLDTMALAALITPSTRAVIAVHLYGQTADVEAIRAAVGPGILIVEDAAQSQGARYRGRRSGALGDVASTSFYPGKNLGAYGDGGAVTTSSDAIAARVRRLRNHGGERRYEHVEVGMNSRLDGIQAVVLSAKLCRLDEWNSERRRLAQRYDDLLREVPELSTPLTANGNEHVFHQYVVRVPDRDRVVAVLVASGIGAAVHYPFPVHLTPAFASLGYSRGTFPRAEGFAETILSLPIYPGLTEDQQEYVVAELVDAMKAGVAIAGATVLEGR